MTSENSVLEAVDQAGRRLRIEFAWQGDRFGHSVSVGQPAACLLESIEGTSGENWPASPPFQSLRMETLTDGRLVALLVGMAGQGYWSASVEAVPGELAFLFDIACRTSGDHSHLGSSYRAPGSASAGAIQIVPLSIDGEFSLIETDVNGSITIRPCDHVHAQSPSSPAGSKTKTPTIRWKYRLSSPAATKRLSP